MTDESFVYGLYEGNETTEKNQKSDLSLDFVFPLELMAHWRKCSLVSNFLANYHILTFQKQKKAQVVLSTVINELIENAIKFNADQNKLVSISLQRNPDVITIETMNTSDQKNVTKVKKFVSTLNSGNYEKLFMDTLEKVALSNSNSSGLGLLTILKDYNAKLGIKIEPSTRKGLYSVLVKACIPISELDTL